MTVEADRNIVSGTKTHSGQYEIIEGPWECWKFGRLIEFLWDMFGTGLFPVS